MGFSITLIRMAMQTYRDYNVFIFAIYGFKLCFLVFLAIFRHFHVTHLHKNIQITKQLSAPALSWQCRWTCNFTGIITDSFFSQFAVKVTILPVLAIFRHFIATNLHEKLQITQRPSAAALSWSCGWTMSCKVTNIITETIFHNASGQSNMQLKSQVSCVLPFLQFCCHVPT